MARGGRLICTLTTYFSLSCVWMIAWSANSKFTRRWDLTLWMYIVSRFGPRPISPLFSFSRCSLCLSLMYFSSSSLSSMSLLLSLSSSSIFFLSCSIASRTFSFSLSESPGLSDTVCRFWWFHEDKDTTDDCTSCFSWLGAVCVTVCLNKLLLTTKLKRNALPWYEGGELT